MDHDFELTSPTEPMSKRRRGYP